MKQWMMCGILAGLLLVPAMAMGQEETNVDYDEIVLTVEKMSELLDQALYLAAAGIYPYSRQQSPRVYGQGIVNLIQGPGSLNYDSTSEFAVEEGSGLQPLLYSLERVAGQLVEFVPAARAIELSQALGGVGRFLGLAGEAAEAAAARPPVTFGDLDDLRTIYAYLLAARGGPENLFLVGGVQTLVNLFPSRTLWVRESESIQAAIDRVPEGGTIYLEPGTYFEPLAISKSVTLAAYAPGVSPAFGDVVIQGVPWKSAIVVESDAPIEVALRDLVIVDGAAGISAAGEAVLRLENVEVRDNRTGISIIEQASVTCNGSRFVRNGTAIGVSSDSPSEFRACSIAETTETGGAVLAFGGGQLVLALCSIVDGAGDGISLLDSVALHLEGTTIAGNQGYGIVAYEEACTESTHIPVDREFVGTITGWGNTIPGPDEENGNLEGSICPAEYEFLLDAAPAETAEADDAD